MRSSKKGVAFAKKNASTGQCSRVHDSNKSTPACPVRIAEKIIRASGMTPRKVPKIKKALIVHNVMLKGLQDSKIGRKYILQASNQHLKSQRCHRVLTQEEIGIGKRLKRYRLQLFLYHTANTVTGDDKSLVAFDNKALDYHVQNENIIFNFA